MKGFVLIALFLHLFIFIGNSQPNRKIIQENRIRKIIKTEYKGTGDKKSEVKTLYSILGDDSLKIINGGITFSYIPIAENGRIVKLEREDPAGMIDEIRFYKYKPDSSYSSETMTLEANTVQYDEFNSKGKPLLSVVLGSDTTRYNYDSDGRLKSLTLIKEGKKTEVKVTEANSAGDPVRVEYVSADGILWGFSTYKYNQKGLQEEIKIFSVTGNTETLISRTVMKYEFY